MNQYNFLFLGWLCLGLSLFLGLGTPSATLISGLGVVFFVTSIAKNRGK